MHPHDSSLLNSCKLIRFVAPSPSSFPSLPWFHLFSAPFGSPPGATALVFSSLIAAHRPDKHTKRSTKGATILESSTRSCSSCLQSRRSEGNESRSFKNGPVAPTTARHLIKPSLHRWPRSSAARLPHDSPFLTSCKLIQFVVPSPSSFPPIPCLPWFPLFSAPFASPRFKSTSLVAAKNLRINSRKP